MKKIIAKIQGGIGNQLFIYATARSFADQHNYKLYFDISNYLSDYRKYELERFNIRFDGYKNIKSQNIENVFLRKIYYKFWKSKDDIKHITDSNIDELNCYSNHNLYFDGYFQSDQYFHRSKIINDLKLLDIDQLKFISYLKKNCCIAHIRRGDYLNFPHNMTHIVLDNDYYTNAFNYIMKFEQEIKIYAITDDAKWVKDNFPDIEILSTNFNDPLIDFYLMTQAKYLITANSSFSWWAAYINNREDKIVIQPKKWKKSTNKLPEQLVNGWIKF